MSWRFNQPASALGSFQGHQDSRSNGFRGSNWNSAAIFLVAAAGKKYDFCIYGYTKNPFKILSPRIFVLLTKIGKEQSYILKTYFRIPSAAPRCCGKLFGWILRLKYIHL